MPEDDDFFYRQPGDSSSHEVLSYDADEKFIISESKSAFDKFGIKSKQTFDTSKDPNKIRFKSMKCTRKFEHNDMP